MNLGAGTRMNVPVRASRCTASYKNGVSWCHCDFRGAYCILNASFDVGFYSNLRAGAVVGNYKTAKPEPRF